MLRRLGIKIADAIGFLLSIPSWLEDQPTGREFERKMLRPELTPRNTPPPRG